MLENNPGILKPKWTYWAVLGLPLLVYLIGIQDPFFWDCILYSKIAHWYLESGFHSLIIPTALDAGHPPFFNLYLALCWKVFGRSLLVSHLCMLPFVTGLVWQIKKLTMRFITARWQPLALLVILLDPALLGQLGMVSTDIPMLFFYLLGLNAILGNRRGWLILCLPGMMSVSTRGYIAAAALLISDLLLLYYDEKSLSFKSVFHRIKFYLFPGLLGIAWLAYHYTLTGWLLSPPEGNWAGQRGFSGVGGMIKNLLIFGWRMLDNGRIILWLTGIPALALLIKGKRFSPEFVRLGIVFLAPFLVLLIAFIPFSNPIGHRYLIICYLLFSLLSVRAVVEFVNPGKVKMILWLCVALLVSGHFWVYPDGVAKGWDSSLAYKSYFPAREEMIQFIKENGISPAETGTGFPNVTGTRFTNLDSSHWSFNFLDFQHNRYVLTTNVSNTFTKAELEMLHKEWRLIHETHSGAINLKLYERPKP